LFNNRHNKAAAPGGEFSAVIHLLETSGRCCLGDRFGESPANNAAAAGVFVNQ
jgi:hypothetical protein